MGKSRVRLHKYIANCGYCSRRHAELLIAAGLVQVNGGAPPAGVAIVPGEDRVTIHGDEIVPPPKMTIALNKPAGFISSTHDTHERLTVMDLLPRRMREWGVFPVGRLDLDTEGLLLLTNDGDLAHRLTHPRYECEKEYRAVVEGRLGGEARRRLVEDDRLVHGMTRPVRIVGLRDLGDRTEVRIVLREGLKRQIRLMFRSVGHEVKDLERSRIGGLTLGDLPRGGWRELRRDEIELCLEGGDEPRA